MPIPTAAGTAHTWLIVSTLKRVVNEWEEKSSALKTHQQKQKNMEDSLIV